MLTLKIPDKEFLDEATGEFITVKGRTIQLEHSLVSVAKWESKWKRPFLSKKEMTTEQMIDYIRCMTITQNVDPQIYKFLGADEFKKIQDYIEDPMSAKRFIDPEEKNVKQKHSTCAEDIYYAMIASQIPPEYAKWHLNRLLMLIRVCSERNKPPKKMSKAALNKRNTALNAQRKAKLHTRG